MRRRAETCAREARVRPLALMRQERGGATLRPTAASLCFCSIAVRREAGSRDREDPTLLRNNLKRSRARLGDPSLVGLGVASASVIAGSPRAQRQRSRYWLEDWSAAVLG